LGVWVTECAVGYHYDTLVTAVFKKLFDLYPELWYQEIEVCRHCLFEFDEHKEQYCQYECYAKNNPSIEYPAGLPGLDGCVFCGAVMGVVV